jgi:hypothetical protein
VTKLENWLASRTPAAPAPLTRRMTELAGDLTFADTSELASLLVERGESLLRDIGSDRASALDLLAADAFITYAMEAAAGSCDDVEAVASMAATRIANVCR